LGFPSQEMPPETKYSMGHTFNQRENESLRAPKSVHKLSLYGGLAVLLAWFAYAFYLIVMSFELPDSGEMLDIAGVAVVMFLLGWAAVRIGHYALRRLHGRIVSGQRD
jgi:prolipoprotein diacylglyceryltransferase